MKDQLENEKREETKKASFTNNIKPGKGGHLH